MENRTLLSLHHSHLKNQRGQVGIVLLLMTVVMLTVGVSAVSRSTTNVNISNTNEQSNRALDAAESSLEQALSQDLSNFQNPGTVSVGDISVNTAVNTLQYLETSVDQGYTVGVNLTGIASNTQLTVQWAKEGSCAQQAGIVLTILNFSGGATPPVRRYYVGPNSCGRNDGFTAASGITGTYRLQYQLNTIAGDELMRIRPVYAMTDLRVSGNNLPTQSYTVKATAQNTNSKETKAVEVSKTLPVAPSVLDYVLYSGTSITQ